MAGLYIQAEPLAGICIQAWLFAGLCNHLCLGRVIAVFPGSQDSAAGYTLQLGRAIMLGSAVASGQVEPQTMFPGLMGLLTGFYIQSRLYYDQIGSQAVPFDRMGQQTASSLGRVAGCALQWGKLLAMLCCLTVSLTVLSSQTVLPAVPPWLMGLEVVLHSWAGLLSGLIGQVEP